MGDVDKKHYTGHRARLRKRFLNDPHNVYAYEMMELLLGYVIRRGDTKPLAKELVERFGGIAGCVGSVRGIVRLSHILRLNRLRQI